MSEPHFTLTINTTSNHAGIVIGKQGSNIKKINQRYNVFAQIHNANLYENQNIAYFTITGTKSNIQNASIHIYNLLHQSMFKTETSLRLKMFTDRSIIQHQKLQIESLTQELNELKKAQSQHTKSTTLTSDTKPEQSDCETHDIKINLN